MTFGRREMAAQAAVAADGQGGALLFELRGERPGRVVSLEVDRLRIGSAKGNDLMLNERGVAAYQLEILRTGDGWTLQRTDPGGAAYLNGEPIQEGKLDKGSILTLGETTLRFIAPGESLSQEELWAPVGGCQEAENRGSRPTVKWAGLALLVLLGVGVVWMFSHRSPSPGLQGQGGSSGQPAPEDMAMDPKVLRPLYDRGKDLLAARRWDEAVVVFAGIRDVAPSFLDTESAYQEALRESANLELLNQGKGLITEGEIGEARRVLKTIDRQSVYYREMERLIREIEGTSLQVRVRLAEEALARGDWELARLEAEGILAKEPENRAAQRVLEEARKKGQPSETEGASRASGGREQEAAKGPEGRLGEKRKAGTTPTSDSGPPFVRGSLVERAVEAYWRGDADGAVRMLEQASRDSAGEGRSSSAEVSRKIEEIRTAIRWFEEASKMEAEGRPGDALKAWASFLSKDREVSGGRNRGSYFDRASKRLARLCYERGKRAFDREDFSDAFFFWHMAAVMAPGDRDIQAGRAKLDEMAQETYREGYALQEMNPQEAIKRWKRVLGMVAPDHPYYLKAKERIAILSGIP